MEPGVENLAILINFGDRGKNPSISTALAVLHILQDHYPERLGLALVINVPFLVNAFFKVVMPFVDPITRQKVKFNPEILKDGFFTPDMAMKDWWGGEPEFEYVHEKYWPNLVSLCEGRVTTWTKNWRALGAKVGTSEWAYKRGIISSSDQDAVEWKADEKDQQVTVTEAPAPPVVSTKISVKPSATSEAGAKPSTAPVDSKKEVSTGGAPTASESHGGPSTTAVSGAGAVASGGGGGGDDGGNGGDGGGGE
jgi:hypothetical protein